MKSCGSGASSATPGFSVGLLTFTKSGGSGASVDWAVLVNSGGRKVSVGVGNGFGVVESDDDSVALLLSGVLDAANIWLRLEAAEDDDESPSG